MVALILAAGYGTRMYPLTRQTPKALLPLGRDRTILGELLAKLERPVLKTSRGLLVSNHRFAAVFEAWFSGRRTPFPWTVLDDGSTCDDNKLGSVGDLAFGVEKGSAREDLLVVGSDNLFEDDLDGLVEKGRGKDAITLGAYVLPDRALASRYGVLNVGSDDRIVEFQEKPKDPKSDLVSTAAYFFPEKTLCRLLEYASSVPKADTLGSFISWLIVREPVFAHRFGGRWVDIGDVASYKKAQEFLSR